MILKNFILSGFEKEKFFGGKNVFFAVDKMGEGSVEGSEGEKKINGKDELKEKKYKLDIIDALDGDLDRDVGFSGVDDYISSTLKNQKDIFKTLFAVQKGKGVPNRFFSNYLSKSNEEREDLKDEHSSLEGSDLYLKVLNAFDESDSVSDLGSANLLLEKKFSDFKKDTLSNFDKILDQQKRESLDKITKLKNICNAKGINLPLDIQEKINKGELEYDNLNKKRDNLEVLFNSVNEEFNKIAPKDFDKSAKSFMFKYNKDKAKLDKINLNEAKMLYFNDFTDKFLDNYFKDFNNIDNSGFRIENINSEIDNYIDIAEKGKTLEDCKEICDELPGFKDFFNEEDGAIQNDLLLNYINETVGLIGSSLNKVKESGENISFDRENILKEIDIESFSQESLFDVQNNVFHLGEIYNKLEKTRDSFYSGLLNARVFKNYVDSNSIDIETKDGRQKLMNAFNDFLEKNNLEVKTDFDLDEVKKMQDSEVPGEIEKRLKSSHSLIDQILSKSDYIDLKNDNPDLNGGSDYSLDDFSNPRRSTLDGINSNFQDKKEYINTLKNDLISEEDDFKKEKIKQLIKKAEGELKGILSDLINEENELFGFNENLDNLEKSHNDSKEEPVVVTLQVIVDLVKELWETYSSNKKWDRDTAKDVAVGKILQKVGGPDNAGKAQKLIDKGNNELAEFIGKVKEELSGRDRKGIRDELEKANNVSGMSKFRYAGIFNVMAEKGDFNINDEEILAGINSFSSLDLNPSNKGKKENVEDFINNLTEEEKIRRLELIFDKEFNDSSMLQNLLNTSESKYNSMKQDGLEDRIKRTNGGAKYFDTMLDKYIEKGIQSKALTSDGYVIPGKNVKYSETTDGINRAMFHEYTKWYFVPGKIGDVRMGIYRIIKGCASGMIHPDLLSDGIDSAITDKVPILDAFMKGQVSLEQFIEYDKFITNNGKCGPSKNSHLFYKRLGVVMKEISDKNYVEPNKDKNIDPSLGKYYWKEFSGKLEYKKFEDKILGSARDVGERGINSDEDWSGFMNGLLTEFENFGYSRGKNGELIEKQFSSEGTENEMLLIRETMKTFIAYHYAKIEGTYHKKGKEDKLGDSFLKKAPEKMMNSNSGSIEEISGGLIENFNSMSGFSNIFHKLSSGDPNVITKYFDGGKGNFEHEFNTAFSQNKESVFNFLKQMQKSKIEINGEERDLIPTWY